MFPTISVLIEFSSSAISLELSDYIIFYIGMASQVGLPKIEDYSNEKSCVSLD